MSQRINNTPVSQENMMPPGFAASSASGPLKPLAPTPATTGPQVRLLKLNEASVKGCKSKLVELMVNTPSARRKLGTVCVNTPGTNGSQKSSGSMLGDFKKPHTPALQHHRKDEAFVKPLNFSKPTPSEDQGLVVPSPSVMKAVPSLPTLYEAEVEHCNPPSWKERREDCDPMSFHQLDDLNSMPLDTDESSEEDGDLQKENIQVGQSVSRRPPLQQQQVNSFAKPGSYYRLKAKKASSNFTRLLTLDEICDLA